ncbi:MULTISPECIES: GDSL-type esterase/lipase family protein [unclassified Streptomyces]|uniref:GDSL-type esterase/lipase family protein n=1 Tax=unclassified Streptomyces TaxID=2593676 RepID=UPI00068FE07A|nr:MULTISPECIES: GDSL-type esterase/lipase family protein [unclassified Streptomyces]
MSSTARTVAVWGAAPMPFGPSFHDQTLRMTVRPTASGTGARLRLSHLYGDGELTVGALSVAVAGSRPRPVTVGGSPKAVLGAGREVLTDVLPVDVARGRDLTVSLYLPDATGSTTHHRDAFATAYLSPPGSGDLTLAAGRDGFAPAGASWYVLSGLTVVPAEAEGTVVAFGDSITDGACSTRDANRRWPDLLRPGRLAVVNAGIGGNRLLSDWTDPAGVRRFGRDVLAREGVRVVVVLLGVNDLLGGWEPGGAPVGPGELLDGYDRLVEAARDAGVRVVGCTLPPARGLGPGREAVRRAVNERMRAGGVFDAVADVDGALRDPADAGRLRAAYDSGDGLHPNDAGMTAIARAVRPHVTR